MDFNSMDIEVLEQIENPYKNKVICFRIDESLYSLMTNRDLETRVTSPLVIFHGARDGRQGNYKDVCPFCSYESTRAMQCITLIEHRNELFLHLIEKKNIRLEWLYIEYELSSLSGS